MVVVVLFVNGNSRDDDRRTEVISGSCRTASFHIAARDNAVGDNASPRCVNAAECIRAPKEAVQRLCEAQG